VIDTWQHPNTGVTITFEDRRPSVKAAEPDVDTLAAFDLIAKAMADTPGHEGRHAAVAMVFGFKTVEAHAAFPNEDGTLGYVLLDSAGEQADRMRLAEQAVVLLAGPIGEKAGPPAWPPRSDDGSSDEKALADIVRRLDLNEKQWNGLVDIARTVTRHLGVKRVADRIGVMLEQGVTLDGRMLKDIHDAVWREIEEQNKPPTQAEIEHAEQVAQHRQWMTDTLAAGVEYARTQADRKLRAECDRLAPRIRSLTPPCALSTEPVGKRE